MSVSETMTDAERIADIIMYCEIVEGLDRRVQTPV